MSWGTELWVSLSLAPTLFSFSLSLFLFYLSPSPPSPSLSSPRPSRTFVLVAPLPRRTAPRGRSVRPVSRSASTLRDSSGAVPKTDSAVFLARLVRDRRIRTSRLAIAYSPSNARPPSRLSCPAAIPVFTASTTSPSSSRARNANSQATVASNNRVPTKVPRRSPYADLRASGGLARSGSRIVDVTFLEYSRIPTSRHDPRKAQARLRRYMAAPSHSSS